MSFRKVNEDDILRNWLTCREDYLLGYVTEDDKNHEIFIDEISEKILKMFLSKIRNMLKNNWKNWMKIF